MDKTCGNCGCYKAVEFDTCNHDYPNCEGCGSWRSNNYCDKTEGRLEEMDKNNITVGHSSYTQIGREINGLYKIDQNTCPECGSDEKLKRGLKPSEEEWCCNVECQNEWHDGTDKAPVDKVREAFEKTDHYKNAVTEHQELERLKAETEAMKCCWNCRHYKSSPPGKLCKECYYRIPKAENEFWQPKENE